jgi:hypothetical protein
MEHNDDLNFGEPTPGELTAIEAEWPLIETEIALLDAEIRILTADGAAAPLDWRRLRHAQRRVLREAAALATDPVVLRPVA